MAVNIQRYSVRLVKEDGSRYNLDKKVRTPEAAHKVFVQVLDLDKRPEEAFAIITLDVRSKLIGVFEVSKGGLNSTIVDPKNVFQKVFLHNAIAVVLGHNHPSGNPTPSKEDIKITKKISAAGEMLNIHVMDHLIIGDEYNFISLREEGVF